MALPTSLDNINATMYALDRLRREKCSNNGYAYIKQDHNRMYPCPSNIKDCSHGRCVVKNKQQCQSLSSSTNVSQRSTPSSNTPTSNTPTSKPYLEWRVDHRKTSVDRRETSVDHRKTPVDHNETVVVDNDTMLPEGKCVYGNFLLKRWCTEPEERRDESVPGVTDVHPFDYDESTGKCSISKDYCEKDMQASYDPRGPTCYSTTGQKVGEFFVGKTVFRGIERTVVAENFAGPGLHLYMDEEGRFDFDQRQVRKIYPREDYTALDISRDNGLKRLYFVRNFLN